ncbi:hypothetical protein PACTADRAFT_2995 [Pachysolen tannophilus NRRL Y-2460]|uniref:Uncharacterized protein n=1 Tax=Pachysolen tannophilus NRRL Y-2460 TaxID=669874 RepID=A0A1E4TU60_PACTA|nr:hypothetical protein PACTADRAFT_2995 [Pachysolen tannophilus NRRL Y-2460]
MLKQLDINTIDNRSVQNGDSKKSKTLRAASLSFQAAGRKSKDDLIYDENDVGVATKAAAEAVANTTALAQDARYLKSIKADKQNFFGKVVMDEVEVEVEAEAEENGNTKDEYNKVKDFSNKVENDSSLKMEPISIKKNSIISGTSDDSFYKYFNKYPWLFFFILLLPDTFKILLIIGFCLEWSWKCYLQKKQEIYKLIENYNNCNDPTDDLKLNIVSKNNKAMISLLIHWLGIILSGFFLDLSTYYIHDLKILFNRFNAISLISFGTIHIILELHEGKNIKDTKMIIKKISKDLKLKDLKNKKNSRDLKNLEILTKNLSQKIEIEEEEINRLRKINKKLMIEISAAKRNSGKSKLLALNTGVGGPLSGFNGLHGFNENNKNLIKRNLTQGVTGNATGSGPADNSIFNFYGVPLSSTIVDSLKRQISPSSNQINNDNHSQHPTQLLLTPGEQQINSTTIPNSNFNVLNSGKNKNQNFLKSNWLTSLIERVMFWGLKKIMKVISLFLGSGEP